MAECLTKKRNYCVNKIYSRHTITTTSGVVCLVAARDYHFFLNPVEYTDPDGKWTFSLGINMSAGAGVEVSGGIGLILGFSFEKGFSAGVFETHSIGAQQGAGANISGTLTFDLWVKEVQSGETQSLIVGGSVDMPIGGGIGGDVAIDLETGKPSFSVSVSVGAGTPGEAHQLYTTTNTMSVNDIVKILIDGN